MSGLTNVTHALDVSGSGQQYLNLLLIGYGRMGQLIHHLAPKHGCRVVGIRSRVAREEGQDTSTAEVALDFSNGAAVIQNCRVVAERRLNLVLGTTGWSNEPRLRRLARDATIGVIASPNFSLSMAVFSRLVCEAASLLQRLNHWEAFVHERHHSSKRDAPSGTAQALCRRLEQVGLSEKVDLSWVRAGRIPGSHIVGFDSEAETIELMHVARGRTALALGALAAAHWIRNKVGWFTVEDLLEDTLGRISPNAADI